MGPFYIVVRSTRKPSNISTTNTTSSPEKPLVLRAEEAEELPLFGVAVDTDWSVKLNEVTGRALCSISPDTQQPELHLLHVVLPTEPLRRGLAELGAA